MKIVSHKIISFNANGLTPIDIYTRLSGYKKFLLESTFQHADKGKYSFIGSNPYQEIIGKRIKTTIKKKNENPKTITADTLTYLKEHFPKLELDLPFPFFGGAIGYIGYDTIRLYEHIGEELPDELNMPDIHFMFYENTIVFDHSKETISFIAININNQSEEELDEHLERLRKEIFTKQTSEEKISLQPIHFQADVSKEQFIEKVKIAKKHIQKGDVFQVVISQRMKAKMEGNPLSFYQKLRESNPSPYMFYINFDDYLVLGASPESLIQTLGEEIITNPIAGTRIRGRTDEEDERLEKELLQDEKEIAEHRMLVDLSRNDLGKVCEIGSIQIPTYMVIEKYEHVMHLVSEVKGKLRKDCTSIDALISCLPAGTVSGAPKIRAMQIINELEENKRGVYAGGIGYINFNHDINIALAIRSLVIKNQKAYLQAGAGIVYDSIPEMEYQETLNKAKSLLEVKQLDIVN